MTQSPLYPFLFVMIPTLAGIALLVIIWYVQGRKY
jgi:hypothetical protein